MFVLIGTFCAAINSNSCEAMIWPVNSFNTIEECTVELANQKTVLDSLDIAFWQISCAEIPKLPGETAGL